MKTNAEKIPTPKELEKEIGEFLAKKFGRGVKVISPMSLSQEAAAAETDLPASPPPRERKIRFDLKPQDLIAYLDQYIVKQDRAKAVLATKICTHFNRIRRAAANPDESGEMVGRIKSNVLMIGPTGVGKTYMVKLIAQKLGVPFIKGDATKFSETGYVGGDVEDLVRELVKEADDDIELAQNGIIYIDEIDKIASSSGHLGPDVSRTGVQRALLKPMEETEVDLRVPHDPISMIMEVEQFRKKGKREKRTVNTRNILFIMSGAFAELTPIIRKRLSRQGIGFGANISTAQAPEEILQHVKAEDIIEFGFESEFVGRLPVRTVFERLTQEDLFQILKNPNNPIILGKKLDFAAYGIDIKFEEEVLSRLAETAWEDNTGARGLVSAVEKALLPFETRLPSLNVRRVALTSSVLENPEESLRSLEQSDDRLRNESAFEDLLARERQAVRQYVEENRRMLSERYNLTLTSSRVDIIADFYSKHIMDVGQVLKQIKSYCDEIKKTELFFFKGHDINIVLEEDAVDFIIQELVNSATDLDRFYHKLTADFEYGLKLIREKTGKNRFFITKSALLDPNAFISNLVKAEMQSVGSVRSDRTDPMDRSERSDLLD